MIIKRHRKNYYMNELITELQRYELTKSDLKKEIEKVVKKKEKLDYKTLYGKRNSTNYLLFFIMSKYDCIDKIKFEFINKVKIELIELIRQNKVHLKKFKVKVTSIEEDILYSKDISLTTLNIICFLMNLSIIIIKSNCYYYFDYGNKVHLLDGIKYKLDIEKKDVNKYILDYFHLEYTDKLLLCVNSYKRADLDIIAKKLCIVSSTYKLKNDLYNAIIKKLNELI